MTATDLGPPPWATLASVYALWVDLDGTFCRSALVGDRWRTWRSDEVTHPERFGLPRTMRRQR